MSAFNTSLSAPDRDALAQQRQQQTNRNSLYEYGAASQHAAIPSASMEVDELEKELEQEYAYINSLLLSTIKKTVAWLLDLIGWFCLGITSFNARSMDIK
ncbi:11897_t:CDS:2, partial [Gigaspora rosea]